VCPFVSHESENGDCDDEEASLCYLTFWMRLCDAQMNWLSQRMTNDAYSHYAVEMNWTSLESQKYQLRLKMSTQTCGAGDGF
jgi:hypothetical protein